MEPEQRLVFRNIAALVLLTATVAAFGGAGLAWTVGQRQEVVRVIETKTVEKLVKVPEKGCTAGKAGKIVTAYSEHVGVGDKDNPDAWTHGNTIMIEVDGVSLGCYIEGPRDLTKVLRVGMTWKPRSGEPV